MIDELKIWIEKRFQCSLPQIYYDMLINGKLQEYKNLSFCFIENGDQTSTDVHFWYAYDEDVSFKDTYNIYLKNGVISKNYFPIGEDSGGNLICFYMGKRNHGAIYFVNHELFSGNPIKVNDTFWEFIHGLGHYDGLGTVAVKKEQTKKEQTKKEVPENMNVNQEQYVAFFQDIKKKLPEKLIEVLEDSGGEEVIKRINYEDRGTHVSQITKRFFDYSESLKKYKECQNNKKLKNNYLPFMQCLRKMDFFCIKCGGKYAGAIYEYDGTMNQLRRAYDDIETFLIELENGPEVELKI